MLFDSLFSFFILRFLAQLLAAALLPFFFLFGEFQALQLVSSLTSAASKPPSSFLLRCRSFCFLEFEALWLGSFPTLFRFQAQELAASFVFFRTALCCCDSGPWVPSLRSSSGSWGPFPVSLPGSFDSLSLFCFVLPFCLC